MNATMKATVIRCCALLIAALLAPVLSLSVTAAGASPASPRPGATTPAVAPLPDPLMADPNWAVEVGAATNQASAADFLGNSYVVSHNRFVAKYSPGGQFQFEFPASDPSKISLPFVAVDRNLNVTVAMGIAGPITFGTGTSALTVGNPSGSYIVSFDRFGQPRWAQSLSGATVFRVAATQDSVAAVGARSDSTGTVGAVWKFDASTGAPRWSVPLVPSVPFVRIFAWDVTLGMSGHVIVGGSVTADFTVGSSPGTPLTCPSSPANWRLCGFVLDLDAVNGNVQHLSRFNASFTEITGVTADDTGIAVVGQFGESMTVPTNPVTTLNSVGLSDVFVISLAPDSTPRWARRISDPGAATPDSVAMDARHRVVASGEFAGTVTADGGAGANPAVLAGTNSYRGVLASYDDVGTLGWTAEAGPMGPAPNYALPVSIDAQGIVHATFAHGGAITVGSGQNAVTVPGSGTALATFSPDGPMPGAGFVATASTRVLDSRTTTGGWNAPLVAGASRTLIPFANALVLNVSAVVVNVTVTEPSADSFLTVYPAGVARPNTSNLNFAGGQTVSNLVTVQVGANGEIELATATGSTQVVIDLVGLYRFDRPLDRLHPVSPTRVLDSRIATGGWNAPLGPGESRGLTIGGVAPVPAAATSAVLSVTVTEGSDNSFLRITTAASPPAPTSNILFAAAQTASNLVMVGLPANGQVTLFNQRGSVQVVVDVVGYFGGDPGGGLFHAMPSKRLIDSRDGTGFVTTPWDANTNRTLTLGGNVSLEAIAFSGNVTATNGTEGSFLRVHPPADAVANTSTLAFAPNQTIPTMTISGMGHNATLGLYNALGRVDVVLDYNGYFQ